MPELVREGLKLKDVQSTRRPFKRVRIGQIFYRDKHWWTKCTTRTAMPADCASRDPRWFKAETRVYVFDESRPTIEKQQDPESFAEFMQKASL